MKKFIFSLPLALLIFSTNLMSEENYEQFDKAPEIFESAAFIKEEMLQVPVEKLFLEEKNEGDPKLHMFHLTEEGKRFKKGLEVLTGLSTISKLAPCQHINFKISEKEVQILQEKAQSLLEIKKDEIKVNHDAKKLDNELVDLQTLANNLRYFDSALDCVMHKYRDSQLFLQ